MATQDAVLQARRQVSECKRSFHSLKSEVMIGLLEASDAFQSISSSLMRLVALKSEQREKERSFSTSSPISSRTEAASASAYIGSDPSSELEDEQHESPVNEMVENLSKITRLFKRQAEFSQEILDRVRESIQSMKDCLASEVEERPLKRANLEPNRGILVSETVQGLDTLESLFRQSLAPNLEFFKSEKFLKSLTGLFESIYQLETMVS